MSTFNELIDFTRSTTGTYLDSVVYGEEVVTNGDFSDGTTGWSTSQTTEALQVVNGKLRVTEDGVADPSVARAYQQITTEVGKTYRVTADIDPVNTPTCALNISNSVSTSESINVQTSSTATTAEFYFTAESTFTYVLLTVNSATTVGSYADFDNVKVKELTGGQVSGTPLLRTAAINEPRLEYDAQGNALGLLIEEARSNRFTESEDMSTVQSGLTVTSNVIIAPDGTLTSDLCVPTAVNTEHSVTDQTTTIGQPTALSFFAKYGSGDYLLSLRGGGIGEDFPSFNVQNGTVVNAGNSNWSDTKIESVGNGWYRCSSVGTPTSTSRFRVQFVSGTTRVFVGDGTGHYIWGIQEEAASTFPTSYIPTNGSTVTRTIDSAVATLSDFYYRQKNGSMVVEFTSKYNASTELYKRVCEIGNTNTSDNRILTYVKTDETRLSSALYDNTTPKYGATLTTSLPNGTGVYSKAAMAWETNNAHAALDGDLVGNADTDVSLTQTRDTLGIMRSPTGTGDTLTGHIKSIQYYPLRVADAKLETLTS